MHCLETASEDNTLSGQENQRQGKFLLLRRARCCLANPSNSKDSRSLNVKAVSIDLKQVKCDTPWASIGEGVSHNELRRPVYLHLLLLRCVNMIRNVYDFKLCYIVVLFSERLSVRSFGWHLFIGCGEMEKNFLRIALLAMNLLYQLIWKVCCWLSVKRIVKVFSSEVCDSVHGNDLGGISEAHISILHVHHVIRFWSVFQGTHHFTAMQWPDSTGAMQLSLTCFEGATVIFSTCAQKFVQKIRVDDRRAQYSCDAGLWNSNGCVSMHLSRECKSFQFGTKVPIVKDHKSKRYIWDHCHTALLHPFAFMICSVHFKVKNPLGRIAYHLFNSRESQLVWSFYAVSVSNVHSFLDFRMTSLQTWSCKKLSSNDTLVGSLYMRSNWTSRSL